MKHHYPDCQGGPTCDCDEREREEIEREMSDTPETDDEIRMPTMMPEYIGEPEIVDASFARKLERERDEARREAEKWRNRAFETQCEAEACPLAWEEVGDERIEKGTESITLLGLLADIRAAVGDPTGKLMQDELVTRCAEMFDRVNRAEALLEKLAAPYWHHTLNEHSKGGNIGDQIRDYWRKCNVPNVKPSQPDESE